jgi:capsular exopolysaccharide synthesis family protein
MSTGEMIVNGKLSIPTENTYSEELENFYGTQVELMQGDSVNNRVRSRLQAANPEWRQGRVRIQVGLAPKTSIFNLRAYGEDPRFTEAYLEATMEEYINLKRSLLANVSAAAKSNLRDEVAQLAARLEKSKEDCINFQSSNSIVFLQENGGNSAAEYLATLNKERAECQSELRLLNSLTLEENLERNQGVFMPSVSVTPSAAGTHPADSNDALPPVANSADTIKNTSPAATTQAALAGFETAYLQVKEKVILLKTRRDQLVARAPAAMEIGQLNAEIAIQEKLLQIFREQSQEQLNNRKHTLAVEIDELSGQIKEWETKSLDASKKLSAFEALKDNQQQLQNTYNQLLASLQTLDMEKGSGQESVTILEPATPALPVPPRTAAHLLMAALVGLVAGFGILILLDRMDDRPASIFELEGLFDHPVLAQLPLVKANKRKIGTPVIQLEDDRHMLVEAYQNLRSALIYKDSSENHPRSIVIASASTQDGKSTVSANLAIALAQAGSRVLLVDADLRRGVLHDRFSVPARPGLAEVLAQQCDWTQAVVPTFVPNLFLLPAGACPQRPGSLFAMHTSRFMAEIAGHYDYYLFDTAPVTAADDVSSLAPHVDGLIMVIRAGFTPGRVAKAALDSLRLRKVNVIGLALNAVQTNGHDYYNYKDKSYSPRHG